MNTIFWVAGPSGAGKTTAVESAREIMPELVALDGEMITAHLPKEILEIDRYKHLARIAAHLHGQGHIVIVAAVARSYDIRQAIENIVPVDWFRASRRGESRVIAFHEFRRDFIHLDNNTYFPIDIGKRIVSRIRGLQLLEE